MPHAGQILGGRYRLERFLGAGSMGSVWAAVHLELDAPVAIKLEHPPVELGSQRTEASRREARAAARLRSPHVVQTFDFGTDDGMPFIAMELLVGESLRARLDSVVRLSPGNASEIVEQTASALQLAHGCRIVHRDIKPSNLFLVREQARESVKVLDFGVAKWLDGDAADSRTDSARLVGSAAYMSPEQARGQTIDHRSDIWSLAVVAYEMLFGDRPFPGSNIPHTLSRICAGSYAHPSALAGRAYAALDPVFARGLNPNLASRFQSARDLSLAFSGAVQGLPAGVIPSGPNEGEGKQARGRSVETASLRVDVAVGRAGEARRTRANKVLGVVLGASLASGAIAWRASSSHHASQSPTPTPTPGEREPALAELSSSEPAVPIASAANPDAAPLPVGGKPRSVNRAAPSGAPRRREAREAPSATPHRDPLFGLEVPTP